MGVKRKEDLTEWKMRAPIRRLADALLDRSDLDEARLEGMWVAARSEVEAAWDAAVEDPFPPAEDLLGVGGSEWPPLEHPRRTAALACLRAC